MVRVVTPSILALLFAIQFPTVVHAQWEQTTGPAGIDIHTLYTSSDTAYAGTGGGLYRSNDGGASWHLLGFRAKSVTAIWSHQGSLFVAIVDSVPGEYLGSEVYRSVDGGATWTELLDRLKHTIRKLWGFGAQGSTIYISASFVSDIGYALLSSTDDGTSWLAGSRGIPAVWVTGIANMNDTLFASTGQGLYMRPNAADSSWTVVTGVPRSGLVSSVYFDGATLYAGTSNGVYYSKDRGATWASNGSVVVPKRFAQSGDKIVADDSLEYFISSDSGVHWGFVANVPAGDHLALAGLSKSFLISTGPHIFALSTQDGTWAEEDLDIINSDTYSLTFLNGALYARTRSGFDRTFDEGATWTHFATAENPGLTSSIAAFGNIFFVGGTGLYRTSDAGATWDTLKGGLDNFSRVTALAAGGTTLYAGSSIITESGLFISADNGNTWVHSDSSITGIVYAIYAADAFVEVFTSDGMYRSIDNGTTWNAQSPPNYFGEYGQTIAGTGDVLITNADGLYRSVDRGLAWSYATAGLPGPDSIETVAMTAPYAFAGTGRGVFFSFNSGATWKPVSDGLEVATPAVAFDSKYIFAGTLGSGVWRRPLADAGVKMLAQGNGATLSNFPNPFASTTSLRFYLKQEGSITLDVVDRLGRTIRTLRAGEENSGWHNVPFDAAGLPAGIYFARLMSASGVEMLPLAITK